MKKCLRQIVVRQRSVIVLAIWCVTLVGLAGLASGCASQGPGYYERLAETVNLGIDAQKTSTANIIDALKVSKAVDDDKFAGLEAETGKVFESLAVIQAATVEAAKAYDAKVQDDKFAAVIDALTVANTASSPINPLAPIFGAVLTTVAGGYGVLKRNEAAREREVRKVTDKKYKAHKDGTEKFMRESGTEGDKLYGMIGDARKKQGVNL